VSPPFKLNANVKATTLPGKGAKASKGIVTVAGWGLTKENGEPSDILQEVDLPVLSIPDCRKKYPKFLIADTMLCTLQPGGGMDGNLTTEKQTK
jgi:Trypsin